MVVKVCVGSSCHLRGSYDVIEEMKRLIKKYGVSLISVGNGTASRESEQVIVELIRE